MPDLLERLKAALADRYAVERELGRGGMATVFLAEDLKHHRKVAIKVLHPELAASVGSGRFLREIEAVASLTHPHVLPLFDSGEVDGLLFFVMPYVEGESLRRRLDREKQLPIGEAIRITRDVAEALDHAHRHGLIHRDIKPGNILLEEGHAVVADFGVVRAISEAGGDQVTATGLAVGTPAYMSPEQAAGDAVDVRGDVYALGCVLYEMLAGEPPLLGSSPQATAGKRVTDRPTPLTALRDTVSPQLAQAVRVALEKAPVDRHQTVLDFVEALGGPTAATVPVTLSLRIRRKAWRGFAVAVALCLVAGTVWIALRRSAPATRLDPDLIAVLPFRVAGTGETLLEIGRGMPDLFWIKVTGDYGPRTADPAAVTSLWESAGGSDETPISEQQAVEIARTMGAGRAVIGVVSGTGDRVALTAKLLDAPSGRVRVSQTSVEGSAGDYLDLADALVNRILARDFGEATHRLPALAAYEPAAVQAYLRGIEAFRNDFSLNSPYFDAALERDSSFVLAALAKYQYGESDSDAARYAWTHQEKLSERDRRLLRALAGWRFGATRTVRERIAQFDSVGLDAGDPSNDVAWNLHVFGRLAEIPSWQQRDLAARQQINRVRPSLVNRFALFELAAAAGDTASMREHAEALRLKINSPGARAASLTADLRLAAAVGDTSVDALWAEAAALLADTFPSMGTALLSPLLDGNNLTGLDRLAGTLPRIGPYSHFGRVWSRARGRYDQWRSFNQAALESRSPVAAAWRRVRDVLFLGEPEDSAARTAAEMLWEHANPPIPSSAADSAWTIEDRDFARAVCWGALWRVRHGQDEGAVEAIQYLRAVAPLPYRWSVCAGIIEVLLAELNGDDATEALARLDSVVSPVPMEDPTSGERDGTHFIDNLFLAQRLLQVGDTLAALRAARRGLPWEENLVWASGGSLIDLLREEARLAPMVGDTVGAIEAYRHYFALRDIRPNHPPWAAQWDSMRVEYAALTGVEASQ